jgi:hypothetical protein
LTINYLKNIVGIFGLFLSTNILFKNTLFAQYPPTGVSGNFGGSGIPTDTIPQEDATGETDTFQLAYFYPDNRARIIPEKDSLLDNYFAVFEEARRRKFDYFNLGSLASAAYPSVYEPVMRRGLDMGIHAYDIYQIKNSDIPFFYQGRPFADFSTRIASQENGALNLRLCRNFSENVNFSSHFKINGNINTRSFPNIQGLRHVGLPLGRNTALGLGWWIQRDKYDGFLTFTQNTITQLDKGGITTDTLLLAPLEVKRRSTGEIASYLTDATTQHKNTTLAYLHYFKLNRRDSTGTKRSYLATHQMTLGSAIYRSSDPFSTSDIGVQSRIDSQFYRTFITDARGVRFYLKDNHVENIFSLSTSRARVPKDSLKKATGQNDWFELGLLHRFHAINQETDTSKRRLNNIIIHGRWNFTPNDDIKVETYAHFNVLGYNIGDYQLRGELFLNLKNIGNLTVKAVNQLYEPTLLQQQLYITQRRVWNNNFSKILETNLSSTIAIPRFKFEGTVAYTLLNNYMYYDSLALPRQASTPLSILQLMVRENLNLGKIHLDNTIAIQKPTEKFLRLPDVSTKHSLYFEGRLFKKVMLTRIGFDIRYNTTWFAPGYMPLTQQFIVQENFKTKGYPSVDVFLSAKVKSFRAFLRMDNLTHFATKGIYYQIARYPFSEGGTIRFGIRWQLAN